MRKIFALLSTLVCIFAIKEAIYIFTTSDPEVFQRKAQFSIVAISIVLPLMLLTLWLWFGKRKEQG